MLCGPLLAGRLLLGAADRGIELRPFRDGGRWASAIMTSSPAALLLALADQFESQGAYAQAIKCLSPLCGETSGELPAVVAQARLRLARLLLAHFDNVQEAKSVLLTAVSSFAANVGREQQGLQCGWCPPAYVQRSGGCRLQEEPLPLQPLATPT